MADLIKALIFDVGGVILCTDNFSLVEKLASRCNLPTEKIEELVFESRSALETTTGKRTVGEHWQNIWDALGLPQEEKHGFEVGFWEGDRINSKMVDYIREQKMFRKTALLSNAWPDLRRRLNDEYRCMDAFDDAVFSCEVKLVKPDPAIFRFMLRRLGVQPTQAVFIDDNSSNVLAAENLGIHAVQFLNNQQTIDRIDEILKEHNGSYLNKP